MFVKANGDGATSVDKQTMSMDEWCLMDGGVYEVWTLLYSGPTWCCLPISVAFLPSSLAKGKEGACGRRGRRYVVGTKEACGRQEMRHVSMSDLERSMHSFLPSQNKTCEYQLQPIEIHSFLMHSF